MKKITKQLIEKFKAYLINEEKTSATLEKYIRDVLAFMEWLSDTVIDKGAVKMPMFYQIEYLIDGEWIYGDSNYCTINTIQGTCRAWIENNVAYYEHWGTGLPVTWDEFWGQFFTEEGLIAAYKNKLYPNN